MPLPIQVKKKIKRVIDRIRKTGIASISDLRSLAKVMGVGLPREADGRARYRRVLTQSEYVTPEDVVISAGWYDPQRIVKESLEKDAVAIFCDRKTKECFPQPNVIGVDKPLECVQRLEQYLLSRLRLKTITITGSVGKTTTSDLIYQVVSGAFPTFSGSSATNSHGGILRNIQRLTPKYKFWVQEVGGIQPGYVESTACVLRPCVTVLTNIGDSHLKTYITKENTFHDKSSLERYLQSDGVVIINADDEMLSAAAYSHKKITVSLRKADADYFAKDIQTVPEGLRFTAVCPDGKEYPVRLNLYGAYNAYNALSAMAVGRHFGIPMDKILERLDNYAPSGIRQNMVHIGGYSLMVDVFSAEPMSVLGSAATLARLSPAPGGRRIFCSGFMNKLGEASPRLHEKLGYDLAKLPIDLIVLYAGESKYTYEALVKSGCKNALFFESRDELDRWIRDNIRHEDIVFFKCGQSAAGLAKTIDHVFGTAFQNEQQYNCGSVKEQEGFVFRLRQDNIAEIERYIGSEMTVTVPEKYGDYAVVRISPGAFRNNKTVRTVKIPDSVAHIGEEAFCKCTALTNVILPSGCRYIGKNAFSDCTALTGIIIPEGTLHIDRQAFCNDKSLKNAVIPASIGFLGEDCFKNAEDLTIQTAEGSYAAQYAKDNSLSVKTDP